MDRVPQKVLSWLHGILLNGYRDVNTTYYDVANALGQFPQLRVETETYTSDNGRSALLLRLKGNISAQHRGSTYQYPVSVWIPYEYPAWPPISYVTPSPGINIRPSQYIAVDGKIYHPYLGESWQPGRSNVTGVLSVITEVFSLQPPLAAARTPVPPVPGSVGRSESLRSQQTISPRPSLAPALPPKPGQERPVSVAGPPSGGQAPPPRPPKPGDSASGPPLPGYQSASGQRPPSITGPPPRPPQHPLSPPGSQHGQDSSHQWQQSINVQPQTARWQQEPPFQSQVRQAPLQQQYESPPPSQQQPPLQSQQQGRQALQPGQPQYPPNYPQRPLALGQPASSGPQGWQTQRAPGNRPPEDLLTSPFDLPLPTHPSAANVPIPPVPPNPEKDALLHAISETLATQLSQSLQANNAALPALQAQHSALSTALSKLQQEFAHLRALDAQVQANESTLHSSLKEADAAIADAKQRPVPNIDETLIAPTVLSNQLYNLVAEEKSCVAAREVLGRGLDRGRVGADQWVRSVRGVAREEWLKKYLIRKAALGMGLSGVTLGAADGVRHVEEKEVAGEAMDDDMSFYR